MASMGIPVNASSEFGAELQKALGFNEEDLITEIQINCKAGELVSVTIQKWASREECAKIIEVLSKYNLVPAESSASRAS